MNKKFMGLLFAALLFLPKWIQAAAPDWTGITQSNTITLFSTGPMQSSLPYPITMCAWVYLDNDLFNNNQEKIITGITSPTGSDNLWIEYLRDDTRISGDGIRIVGQATTGGTYFIEYPCTGACLASGTGYTHCFIGNFISSTTWNVIYDGVTLPGAVPVNGGGAGKPLPANMSTIYVGNLGANSGTTLYGQFQGVILDVQIYNRLLSAQEEATYFQSHAHLSPGSGPPVYWYKMDDAGSTVTTSTGTTFINYGSAGYGSNIKFYGGSTTNNNASFLSYP
jgi:hypothetical protein